MSTKHAQVPAMHRVKFRWRLGDWGAGFAGLWPASRHHLDLRAEPAGDIEFALSDRTIRMGFHFDTNDPIWVHVDNGDCPPPGCSHPEIDNIRPAGDCVTVHNRKASGRVRLRYQLNVLDGGGQRVPIDPIIEN